MAAKHTPSLVLASVLTGALLLLAACSASRIPVGPETGEARLDSDSIVTADGAALPLRVWLPEPEAFPTPTAVIVALHGFNDYSKAFEEPATWWAERGIATYAYDQRGFGDTEHRGLWAGTELLVRDLRTASRLVAGRHPDVPLYVLGVSMGGAVAMVAMASDDPPPAQGAILSGPAVWSRDSMPPLQRGVLWVAARTIPWARFTGSGLKIQASDNIEMLRGLGSDPAVIKATRVDAMDGLTDLMSSAYDAAAQLTAPALLLYGDRDEVVPREPSLQIWRNLPESNPNRQRVALYPEGWHMLLRDLQADVVRGDIASWITDPTEPLPSGADGHAVAILEGDGEIKVASEGSSDGEPVVEGGPADDSVVVE